MNNDRLKFRAWHKTEKKMYEVDSICPYEDESTKGGEVFLKGIEKKSFYFPEEVELGQCTGLKDRHGNLIYEGDIVRLHFKSDIKDDDFEDLEVRYDDNFLCWVLYDKVHNFCDDTALGADEFKSEDFEIIGNINQGGIRNEQYECGVEVPAEVR